MSYLTIMTLSNTINNNFCQRLLGAHFWAKFVSVIDKQTPHMCEIISLSIYNVYDVLN